MLSVWKQYSPAAEKMQRLRGCVLNLFTSIHWRQVDFSGCMLLVGESGYTCREPVDMAGEKAF